MESIRLFTDAIGEELQYVGAYFFGPEHLARNDKPQRYVWVPDTVNVLPVDELGTDPRVLRVGEHTFSVNLFGATYDDVLAMWAALITATDKALMGARWEAGALDWSQNSDVTGHWHAVAPVSLLVPIPVVTYPTNATSDPPAQSVVEDAAATVLLDDVEAAEPEGGPGDGFYELDEE